MFNGRRAEKCSFWTSPTFLPTSKDKKKPSEWCCCFDIATLRYSFNGWQRLCIRSLRALPWFHFFSIHSLVLFLFSSFSFFFLNRSITIDLYMGLHELLSLWFNESLSSPIYIILYYILYYILLYIIIIIYIFIIILYYIILYYIILYYYWFILVLLSLLIFEVFIGMNGVWEYERRRERGACLVCVRACAYERWWVWGRKVKKEKEKRKPIETTYIAMTTVYYTYHSSRNDYSIIERWYVERIIIYICMIYI